MATPRSLLIAVLKIALPNVNTLRRSSAVNGKSEGIMADDFCIEHGTEFMACAKVWGAIPYCKKCEQEAAGPSEAIEAIREDLREILNAPAPEPTFREMTTKYGVTFKIRES